jgi:hypothetical protein
VLPFRAKTWGGRLRLSGLSLLHSPLVNSKERDAPPHGSAIDTLFEPELTTASFRRQRPRQSASLLTDINA